MRFIVVSGILFFSCIVGCQTSDTSRFRLFVDKKKSTEEKTEPVENPLKRELPKTENIITASGESKAKNSKFSTRELGEIKAELKHIPREEHQELRDRWEMMDSKFVMDEIRLRKQTRLAVEASKNKSQQEIASVFESSEAPKVSQSDNANLPQNKDSVWGHSGQEPGTNAPTANPFEQSYPPVPNHALSSQQVLSGHSISPVGPANQFPQYGQSSPFAGGSPQQQMVPPSGPQGNYSQTASVQRPVPGLTTQQAVALHSPQFPPNAAAQVTGQTQGVTASPYQGLPGTQPDLQPGLAINANPVQNTVPQIAQQPAGAQPIPLNGSQGIVETLTNAPNSLRELGARFNPFNINNAQQPAVPSQMVAAKLANNVPAPNAVSLPVNQQDLLAQLISILESEVEQLRSQKAQTGALSPEQVDDYVQKNVNLRMLYLMSAQEARALQAIPGIEAADQEFWVQLFWALSNYFDRQNVTNPTERATQTVSQLQIATQRLQEKAQLTLKNVNFCRIIDSYGSYEKFPQDEFPPGQPVLVYAEIENFKSELDADSYFRTRLKSKIEFYRDLGTGIADPDVKVVDFQDQEDICRNHRRDYFHTFKLFIPKELTPGQYIMKMTVEDLNGNDFDEETLRFRVL